MVPSFEIPGAKAKKFQIPNDKIPKQTAKTRGRLAGRCLALQTVARFGAD
jgi:hypothetical protein